MNPHKGIFITLNPYYKLVLELKKLKKTAHFMPWAAKNWPAVLPEFKLGRGAAGGS